jgi:hypothetical protein
MKVWAGLYGLVWLVFLELLVAIDPKPPAGLIFVHVALGLLIVLLAAVNYRGVRQSEAPGRIKRTVRATFALSMVMVGLGLLLWANTGAGSELLLGYSLWDLLNILHVVNALAIFAQAAAAASAFDMWEEKEFAQPSRPNEIPPPPQAAPR